jgi:hypothetical protein
VEARFEVETALGPVWFWGRDTGLPVMLLITGAFADFDTLDGLHDVLAGVDVWRAHLPGNHCPPLAATSVGAFAGAYGQAISARLGERPVVATGLSVGALVALGLRSANVRRIVAVEPPLLTAGLWPLLPLREEAPAGSDEFLWNVLGIGRDAVEPRDYTALLDQLSKPTAAILGTEPLGEPRDWTVMPSLVTEPVRARLAAHPRIQVFDALGAGHNVAKLATDIFLRVVVASCQKAFGPAVHWRPPPEPAGEDRP